VVGGVALDGAFMGIIPLFPAAAVLIMILRRPVVKL
jgi:hypothetical protein